MGGKREKKAASHFLFAGEDAEESQWCDGGIGDIHGDVKSLFQDHDILKASHDFFVKKIELTNGQLSGVNRNN